MRLLNTETLQLHDFTAAKTPPYAILSHTWEDGEVSFQGLNLLGHELKKGWKKVEFCCKQAQSESIQYAWVDT